ncbi:MAG: hypothetical protein MHM6MM_002058 [Cercozoa sp. M6MM]
MDNPEVQVVDLEQEFLRSLQRQERSSLLETAAYQYSQTKAARQEKRQLVAENLVLVDENKRLLDENKRLLDEKKQLIQEKVQLQGKIEELEDTILSCKRGEDDSCALTNAVATIIGLRASPLQVSIGVKRPRPDEEQEELDDQLLGEASFEVDPELDKTTLRSVIAASLNKYTQQREALVRQQQQQRAQQQDQAVDN